MAEKTKLAKAKAAYDKAQEKYQAALEDLRGKREELDEELREEALAGLAAYIGLDPEDEQDLEAARAIQRRRRERRDARLEAFVASSEGSSEAVGGVS